jgi:type I restriction enzyme S subunit
MVQTIGGRGMSEWKECKLGGVALIVDCEHKTAPLVDNSEYLSVRTTDINNGKINFYNANRVSEQTFLEWTKRIVPKERDIILAREAPVGEVGWVDNKYKVCLGQRTVLIRPDSNYIEPRYLFYYLVNKDAKNDLISQSTGSVVQHLNVKNIREFVLNVIASIPEQRAIASVLSSLDDKIDLLHRQNKTLEAMAEADEGWEEVPLSFFAENIRENVKVVELIMHSYYVGLEHIPRKNIVLNSWAVPDSLESNKSRFKKGDILFGKLRSYFHKVVFAPIDGICSTDILVIRPKHVKLFSFCLFWFFNENVVEHSDLGAGGTRMPRTSWEIVSSYRVPNPPSNLIENFDSLAKPIIEKIKMNIDDIHTLEKLRDTLLPKLMSGEVRVAI